MTEAVEFRFVGEVQRLELKPSDALICRVSDPISDDTAKRIRAFLKERFPANDVVVLGGGMELSVVERAMAKTDRELPFRVASSEALEGGRWEVNHDAIKELIELMRETAAEIKKLRRS